MKKEVVKEYALIVINPDEIGMLTNVKYIGDWLHYDTYWTNRNHQNWWNFIFFYKNNMRKNGIKPLVITDYTAHNRGEITFVDDTINHVAVYKYRPSNDEDEKFVRTMALEWVRFKQELPHATFNDFMACYLYEGRDYYDEWKRGELLED